MFFVIQPLLKEINWVAFFSGKKYLHLYSFLWGGGDIEYRRSIYGIMTLCSFVIYSLDLQGFNDCLLKIFEDLLLSFMRLACRKYV